MPEVRNIGTLFREMDEVKQEIRSVASFYGDALDSLFIRLDAIEAEIAKIKGEETCAESDPPEGFPQDQD